MVDAPPTVEVRSLMTQSLVQQLDLPQAKFILTTANGRGPIFAASERTIWKLIPRPFQQQVDELLQGQQYVDALALLEQIDSIPHDEKVSNTS